MEDYPIEISAKKLEGLTQVYNFSIRAFILTPFNNTGVRTHRFLYRELLPASGVLTENLAKHSDIEPF